MSPARTRVPWASAQAARSAPLMGVPASSQLSAPVWATMSSSTARPAMTPTFSMPSREAPVWVFMASFEKPL